MVHRKEISIVGVIRECFLTRAEFKLNKDKTEKHREYLPGITNVSKGRELRMYHKLKGLISRIICGGKRSMSKKENEKGKMNKTSWVYVLRDYFFYFY